MSTDMPFNCYFDAAVAALLADHGISLAISTYKTNRLVFISPLSERRLMQHPRAFNHPMGIAVDGDLMALATVREVTVFRNARDMAPNYPKKPGHFDSLWVPIARHYTGVLDIHDICRGADGLLAVNTQFSCLCRIGGRHHFSPTWKPPFLSAVAPGDRCHLNGVAMQDGRPRYVTALGDTDTPEGWRARKLDGGVLVDVAHDAVVLENLPMPHSPRLIDGELWLLLSATGELVRVDPARGTVDVMAALNCFVRGLAPWGDYLFIGVSRIRKTSTDFQDLPVADDSDYGGIIVVHRPTAAVVGRIRYEDTVEEIYDIQVLPDQRMPGILNTETPDFQSLLVTPEQGYWLDEEADEG